MGGVSMGFLDRLLKRTVRNAVNQTVDRTVDRAVNNALNKTLGDNSVNHSSPNAGYSQNNTNYSAPQPQRPQQINGQNCGDLSAYFYNILAGAFPDYEIKAGIPATAIGASNPAAKNYDFCLFKAGRVAAAIMLTPHNRDRNSAFLTAKAACYNAGIPFINFYTHYPNEREYVINRVKSFIKA